WNISKKKKAKDEIIVTSEIPEDSEDILTMPDNVIEEGLITKPDVVDTPITLSTSESMLPFTAPMEDANYAEAEMLNKLEAESEQCQAEQDEPMIEALNESLALEMESSSEELMDILKDLESIEVSPDSTRTEAVLDIEDVDMAKARRKQALDQILSSGNSNRHHTLTKEDMHNIFSQQEVAKQKSMTPTERVNSIFGKNTKVDDSAQKPTPTQCVHNVFGREEKRQTQNEVPTRDSMREMLSSQKKKSNYSVPTKDDLFKTITDKDR
ncbi:MAG: hypothetical protein IKC79_03645, partial [Clostridia bacterium]|nr:hypothetical protein [Clostridia bacterium]